VLELALNDGFDRRAGKQLGLRTGNARYPEGRAAWLGSRGLVDLADSLAAIKKLVFDAARVKASGLSFDCRLSLNTMTGRIIWKRWRNL